MKFPIHFSHEEEKQIRRMTNEQVSHNFLAIELS